MKITGLHKVDGHQERFLKLQDYQVGLLFDSAARICMHILSAPNYTSTFRLRCQEHKSVACHRH